PGVVDVIRAAAVAQRAQFHPPQRIVAGALHVGAATGEGLQQSLGVVVVVHHLAVVIGQVHHPVLRVGGERESRIEKCRTLAETERFCSTRIGSIVVYFFRPWFSLRTDEAAWVGIVETGVVVVQAEGLALFAP
ncbi:MAG: hypothetical protein DRI92_05330, partial [Aquificota bacterium]